MKHPLTFLVIFFSGFIKKNLGYTKISCWMFRLKLSIKYFETNKVVLAILKTAAPLSAKLKIKSRNSHFIVISMPFIRWNLLGEDMQIYHNEIRFSEYFNFAQTNGIPSAYATNVRHTLHSNIFHIISIDFNIWKDDIFHRQIPRIQRIEIRNTKPARASRRFRANGKSTNCKLPPLRVNVSPFISTHAPRCTHTCIFHLTRENALQWHRDDIDSIVAPIARNTRVLATPYKLFSHRSIIYMLTMRLYIYALREFVWKTFKKKNHPLSAILAKMPGLYDIDLKYENSTDDEYLLWISY